MVLRVDARLAGAAAQHFHTSGIRMRCICSSSCMHYPPACSLSLGVGEYNGSSLAFVVLPLSLFINTNVGFKS
eukprot:scaffold267831_cov31-Tisochrysis_lutea.AAC.2